MLRLSQNTSGLRPRAAARDGSSRPISRRTSVVVSCKQSNTSPSAWIHSVAAGIIAAGTVVGTPLPAMAQPTLTQKQAQEAQELLAIIEKRTGKGLPRLQASPSVATQEASAPALKADNASAASVAALKKQLEQLNAKLAKEEAERDAARAAVSKLQSELEQERAREAAATKDAASARAAADAARAAATKSAAEAKSRATTISAPVAAPAPAPAPAPVEKKAAAASEDNDSNPALGLLNALGIVVGGGLGGYVFVLNRNKETSEDELSGKLASEQAAVAELQRQTAAIQASLEAERKLADKLRSDMQAASEQAKKLIEAEQREREASQRATALSERALEAEKKLAEAMRAEAKAAAEAAEAERAAKFVAEAEARAAAEQLARAEATLAIERNLTRQIGTETQRMRDQIRKTEADMGMALLTAEKLKAELESERASAQDAEAAIEQLTEQIVTSNSNMERQQELLAQVGKEAMDMREAMRKLRSSAGDIAIRAQKEAESAALLRGYVEADLATATQQMESERAAAEAAREEARTLKQSLAETKMSLANAETALAETRAANEQLNAKVAELQSRIQSTEAALASEKQGAAQAKTQAAELSKQLASLQDKLQAAVKQLEAEKTSKEALKADLAKARADANTATAGLESEKATAAALRAEADKLKKQIDELQKAGVEMRTKMNDMNSGFQKRLSTSASEAEAAKASKMALEIKTQQLGEDLDKARAKVSELEATNAKSKDAQDVLSRELDTARARVKDLEGAVEAAAQRAREETAARLSSQLEQVQARLATVESERDSALTSSTRALEEARSETAAAQLAAATAVEELSSERKAREAAEAAAKQLRGQLDNLLKSTEQAQEAADAKLATLKSSIEQVKQRQQAKAKSASPAGPGGKRGGSAAPAAKAAPAAADGGAAKDAAPAAPAPPPAKEPVTVGVSAARGEKTAGAGAGAGGQRKGRRTNSPAGAEPVGARASDNGAAVSKSK